MMAQQEMARQTAQAHSNILASLFFPGSIFQEKRTGEKRRMLLFARSLFLSESRSDETDDSVRQGRHSML